jgi:hypothetical protein
MWFTDISEVLAASFIMLKEAVRDSETSVNFHRTKRRNITEDSRLRTRHRENLKSHHILA